MRESKGERRTRVVIVDDHPMLREGTRALLEKTVDIEVVGTAGRGTEALRVVAELKPDVLILDVRLPDVSGVEVTRRVREAFPEVAILILTGYDDVGYLRALLDLGIKGYLRKTARGDEIIEAVRLVARGKKVLDTSGADNGEFVGLVTARERDMLRMIGAGMRNSDIADALGLSSKTVEFHISNLLQKLGARSRTEAILKAQQLGLIVEPLGQVQT